MASKKQSAKDELTAIFPEEVAELSTGEQILVHPFYVKDWKRIGELLQGYEGLFLGEAVAKGTILQLMVNDTARTDMTEIIKYACDASSEQLEEMRGDDFIELFMKAIEVNGDFLLARVQNTLFRFEEMLKIRQRMQPSSPPSSETDTNLVKLGATEKAS